jgi:phenylacetate-coenzyme A ligase PaaK-like adenylate-forming protein
MSGMAVSYEWSPEEQREYSLAKLLKYIEDYVYPFHPYYRKVFMDRGLDPRKFRSYADLRRIPVTTRAEVLADQRAFVLRPGTSGDGDVEPLGPGRKLSYVLKTLRAGYSRDVLGSPRPFSRRVTQTRAAEWEPTRFTFSSGVEGDRLAAGYTEHDSFRVMPVLASMLYLFGWEPGMRGLAMAPGLPHFAVQLAVAAGLTVEGGTAAFVEAWDTVRETERLAEIASRLPFDMFLASPSYMGFWLGCALEMMDEDPEMNLSQVRFALLPGEPLPGERREELKGLFEQVGSHGVEVLECYGSSELRAAFPECGEGAGIHLDPEYYFWEVLDPDTMEPVGWGEPGVLCFSHVGWRGTVLLRYWTGDIAERGVTWDRCPRCGLTFPVLRPPVGRLKGVAPFLNDRDVTSCKT